MRATLRHISRRGRRPGSHRTRARGTPSTPNQQADNVRYYNLDLVMTPASSLVSGTVRMKVTVLSGPLAAADLDLASNMIVDAVTSNGAAATSSRPPDLVTVNLDPAYFTGETIDITVTYHGTPTGGSFGFQTVKGRTLIWSLSEPFGARAWWPCKDAPEDKADSVEVRFTVPSGLLTASNGTRVEATDNGTVAVTRWRERYPIATYLVSIASYPYATSLDGYRPTPTDSMPIQLIRIFPTTRARGCSTCCAGCSAMRHFFAALQQYAIEYGYSTAVTENFRDVCEAVSGRDLDAYFQRQISADARGRNTWPSTVEGGLERAHSKRTQCSDLRTCSCDLIGEGA